MLETDRVTEFVCDHIAQHVGQPQPIESLRSSIWRLRDKSWQLAFHQGAVRTHVDGSQR